MLSKVITCATYGVNAYIVEVETHIEKQIPGFSIVGLPDIAVKESRERITAAIKNCSFDFPIKKLTINLAPADIKKEGSAFDLPMAVGILASTEQVMPDVLEEFVLLGELALDGSLRPIHGTLPMALEVRKNKVRGMIVPKENGKEAAMADVLRLHVSICIHALATFESLNLNLPRLHHSHTNLLRTLTTLLA